MMSGEATIKPLVTIRASHGWVSLRLVDVWQFRDLLYSLAQRDLKLRYRQTALGVAWVVVQPLLGAGVFAFVFGAVAGMTAPKQVSYFLFAYTGLQGWNLFGGTLTRTSVSLVGNSHLITKVYFPRLILPFSTVASVLVDFGCSGAMLAALMMMFGQVPGWGLVLLPLWIAVILALAMGLGLVSSALAVSYRDIQYIVPVFLQILLYASPVAYSVGQVPPHLRAWYDLNPLTAPLEGFRWAILGVGEITPWAHVYSGTFAFGLLLVGALGFRRMERRIADVI